MWPLISPASGGTGFLHLGLDEAVAGLPHDGLAAEFGHAVEQRLARLHVGNDRGARDIAQDGLREDRKELVTPDHAALAIHGADAIGVSVERHAEIEALVRNEALQILQIGFDSGSGW
jgi:hypothetical protein